MAILLLCISLISSVIGAITGIGGGVIIKPTVDALGVLSVSAVSFLSGVTVLCMSTVSVLRSMRSSIRVEWRISAFLALGSAAGGIFGKWLFDFLKTTVFDEQAVGQCQSAILLILVVLVFIYTLFRSKIVTRRLTNIPCCIAAGMLLGMTSAFLGIGGGPINLVLLYYVFSMDTKTAAVNSLFIIMVSQISSLLLTVFTKNIPVFEPIHLIVMIAGGVVGGLIGSRILKKINVKGADRIFQILLGIISCICIYNIFKM